MNGHLEGVLTYVSTTGPWLRLQGVHLREPAASRVGLRLSLDRSTGVTVDVHLGSALWLRAGWVPAHTHCRGVHHCWARLLTPRTMQRGLA